MEVRVSRGHTRPLTEISFSAAPPGSGGETLLTSSAHDKTPQIRNGETGDWIGSFIGHKGAVWSARLDPASGTLAATASGDFTARLWCATSGKELAELKHKHVVRAVDFSMDSLKLMTGSQDGQLRIYDTTRPAADFALMNPEGPGRGGSAIKVAWSRRDASAAYVGTKAGFIQMFDTRSPRPQVAAAALSSNGACVADMELSESHNKICAACENKVYVLDSRDLSVVGALTMPEGLNFQAEGGVSLHPDGSKLCAGGSDLWLREFDVASGSVLRTLKGHHGPVRCIRYHPSGKTVASGSEDATIRIWKL